MLFCCDDEFSGSVLLLEVVFNFSLWTASRISEPSSKSFCSNLCGSVFSLSALNRPLQSASTHSLPWLLLFFKQFVQCFDAVYGHFRWMLCVFCLHLALRRRVSPTWRTNSSISAEDTAPSLCSTGTVALVCSSDGIVTKAKWGYSAENKRQSWSCAGSRGSIGRVFGKKRRCKQTGLFIITRCE